VFRNAEFRALWAAELVSICGDQLARVAFSVLVYGRTGSAAWAAAVYALTFLPALLGGVLLGWVADRFRRREIMVLADIARSVLVVPLAVPGIPLPLLCPLLVLVVVLASPHTAAQGALLPDVLVSEELLERGFAVRQITNQTAQIAGFAGGGTLLVLISPSVAILLNAGTFLLSALILRFGVRRRSTPAPAADGAGPAALSWLADILDGARMVVAHRRLRTLALAVWLVGGYIAQEALAAPLAVVLDAGPWAVGLLMAADPAGSVLGALVISRWVPEDLRERAIIPCAALAGGPLVASMFVPDVGAVVVLWAVTGALCTAALVPAQAAFVRITPDEVRGRATGLAASGLIAVQGLAILVGGLVAERWGAPLAVGACGAAGVVLAAGLMLTPGARAESVPRSVRAAQDG
jgi:MFS family permease